MSRIGRTIALSKALAGRLRTAIRGTALGTRILGILARVGYATHGLLYLFVGLLAMSAALGKTSPPSLGEAFSIIDELPGGWLLLLTVALGLCAHAGWRSLDALLDFGGHGWRARGLFRRAGKLAEALFYAGLGILAAVIALDRSAQVREELREEAAFLVVWTGRVLDWPLGHWLVAAVGIGAIVVGVLQILRSRRDIFRDMSAGDHAMIAIRFIGRTGFAARAAIFGVVGVLFLSAAWRVEASAAGGVRAALTALASVPLGDFVLLALSAGLMLHGVFGLVKACCHNPVNP